MCKLCGESIPYNGSGGVRRICDSCKSKLDNPPLTILVCSFCGNEFTYSGRGRPKLYCSDECRSDSRRLYLLKYMDKYRQKRRNLFF